MDENKKIDNNKAMEIRSEEIDEILGRQPNRLIRWGIANIFIVITVILIGSYFYKYPDIIVAPVTITTENMPVNLIAKTNGKISHLFVKDKQTVTKEAVLAIIENPADFNDIQKLKLKLDALKYCFSRKDVHLFKTINTVSFKESYILGDVQNAYMSFLSSLNDYNIFFESDFQNKKINGLRQQIQKYYALQKKIIVQSQLTSEQLGLTQFQYSRDSSLFKNKVISESDFEKSKNALLQNKFSYENAKSNIDNSKITISQLEQNILESQQQWDEKSKQLYDQLANSFNVLMNQINTWEKMYLLITPISGKVTLTKFWSENQDIKAGENVLTVIPIKTEKLTGKLQLPVAGSGKVKVGEKVNIKLDNYPYLEYGTLRGRVQNISLVAIENNYFVEIDLPAGLTTNYNRTLPFTNQLQGNAEIITEDIRLIERFLQPLKSMFKQNVEK
jgi:HlyD family secretion protein